MPDHSPSTDERASLAQLSQSSLPLECTSHLGFGLGVAFLETFHNQGFYAKTKQKAKEIGCGQMPNVLLKIGERLVENIPI